MSANLIGSKRALHTGISDLYSIIVSLDHRRIQPHLNGHSSEYYLMNLRCLTNVFFFSALTLARLVGNFLIHKIQKMLSKIWYQLGG